MDCYLLESDNEEVMNHHNGLSISFEVFPANTPEGMQKLHQTCAKLNTLKPNFISVTYGAAGASQLKTLDLVNELSIQKIPVTPHLSCVGMTKERLQKLLDKYRQSGINKLIVIRGDCVEENTLPEIHYASELVQTIRQQTGNHFDIYVAAYPEFHPQSLNTRSDLIYFKEKIEAGANCAITQFFFNNDAYSQLRENCHKLGITVPIIPGIMPIYDYDKLQRFAKACDAEIPLWLRKQLDSCSGNVSSIRALGIEWVTKLCERLLSDGAEGFHFYTLNQLDPALNIYNNLFGTVPDNVSRVISGRQK